MWYIKKWEACMRVGTCHGPRIMMREHPWRQWPQYIVIYKASSIPEAHGLSSISFSSDLYALCLGLEAQVRAYSFRPAFSLHLFWSNGSKNPGPKACRHIHGAHQNAFERPKAHYIALELRWYGSCCCASWEVPLWRSKERILHTRGSVCKMRH